MNCRWWIECWRSDFKTLRVDWLFREYGGHRGAGYMLAKILAENRYTVEKLKRLSA